MCSGFTSPFDFTDAHLFVTLDALDSESVCKVWRDSVRLANINGNDAAIRNVLAGLHNVAADEARILQSFLTRAIERGLH